MNTRNVWAKRPQRQSAHMDLRPYFPRFINGVTLIGENDVVRGAKLQGTSYRVVTRWRHGQIPVRWLRLTPELLRALADDIEALRATNDFAKVFAYLEQQRGKF